MARVLDPAQVRQLLPMTTCIDLMESALRALAERRALNPLRQGLRLPDGRGLLGTMPGYLKSPEVLGLKAVAILHGNHGGDLDAHQGVVVLFSPVNGVPLAILDASAVTAIRTAAVSGLATRLLARPEATTLAILGSGIQARSHLEAMLCVRPIERVRVYSPNPERRAAFAGRESRRHDRAVEAVAEARRAVDGADIVCLTTTSTTPVLRGDWLEPGQHVNAAGACTATARELDGEAMARSRIFCDSRESLLHESGDYLLAREEGQIASGHRADELGELLLGKTEGRRSATEITLFESLGLAVEDLAAAHHVLQQARKRDVGIEVPLGGRR